MTKKMKLLYAKLAVLEKKVEIQELEIEEEKQAEMVEIEDFNIEKLYSTMEEAEENEKISEDETVSKKKQKIAKKKMERGRVQAARMMLTIDGAGLYELEYIVEKIANMNKKKMKKIKKKMGEKWVNTTSRIANHIGAMLDHLTVGRS